METYNGHVRTPQDAIILFEACRMGLLPRVQRRLSEKERQSIRSGSVFVWDEREAGMRRWTDGKSWSASRVSGSFLTYREMEGKRGGGGNFAPPARGESAPETTRNGDSQQQEDAEEGPDGYRYKPDGLVKQSFSITTSQGQHLHLISYFARSNPTAPGLMQPSNDPSLRTIRPQKGMYPESSVNDQSNVPAVTRSPMPGAPNYAMAPQSPVYPRQGAAHPQTYMQPGYPTHPAYQYPLNGMQGSPPASHQPMPYYTPAASNGLPSMNYAPGYGHPMPHMHQPQPQPQPQPPIYDQRPIRPPESSPPAPQLQVNHQSNGGPPTGMNGYIQAPPNYAVSQSPADRESSREQAAAALQIDPRLMGAAAPQSLPAQTTGPTVVQQESDQKAAENNSIMPTTSQPPTITSIINGNDKTMSSNATASTATAGKEDAEQKENEPSPSSPGGTKQSGNIQDIPSEKLGFREDKRALRQLDKVFAA